eukprot:CAMPEP_0176394644 /NCGR_PEP_ID=MMETSP0126-20121128/42750_1 /TAXON_ID=141414 ORGANISM="Strombidinopsis acuminatum, Strain SPMC142" /NCGR_SAMPLE_ID=MMETSP0126 /ASSEMBLY_ACC=CAM_ASM_000229 /LENGTH=111 /DNA_ID=CAMNT_0017766999 /DNA_START=33 /DNA_END=368 /DNA_ORIENTATION=+
MVDPARANNDLAADDGEKNHIPLGVILLDASNRDNFPNKPYYDDGNPEMYTNENIAKREALREHEIVKEAITDFIKEFATTGSGHVSKDEYFRVFVKIGMILRPGIDADDL